MVMSCLAVSSTVLTVATARLLPRLEHAGLAEDVHHSAHGEAWLAAPRKQFYTPGQIEPLDPHRDGPRRRPLDLRVKGDAPALPPSHERPHRLQSVVRPFHQRLEPQSTQLCV